MAAVEPVFILRKPHIFWPLVLFPYYLGSHTSVFTGRRFIRDVKFSSGFASLYLTEQALICRQIFPSILLLEIRLSDITQVSQLKLDEAVLEVRFNQCKLGGLAKISLSGDAAIPRDRVLLNLGKEATDWQEALLKRIPHPEESRGAN